MFPRGEGKRLAVVYKVSVCAEHFALKRASSLVFHVTLKDVPLRQWHRRVVQ
jgi:hypothetical protein